MFVVAKRLDFVLLRFDPRNKRASVVDFRHLRALQYSCFSLGLFEPTHDHASLGAVEKIFQQSIDEQRLQLFFELCRQANPIWDVTLANQKQLDLERLFICQQIVRPGEDIRLLADRSGFLFGLFGRIFHRYQPFVFNCLYSLCPVYPKTLQAGAVKTTISYKIRTFDVSRTTYFLSGKHTYSVSKY